MDKSVEAKRINNLFMFIKGALLTFTIHSYSAQNLPPFFFPANPQACSFFKRARKVPTGDLYFAIFNFYVALLGVAEVASQSPALIVANPVLGSLEHRKNLTICTYVLNPILLIVAYFWKNLQATSLVLLLVVRCQKLASRKGHWSSQ